MNLCLWVYHMFATQIVTVATAAGYVHSGEIPPLLFGIKVVGCACDIVYLFFNV